MAEGKDKTKPAGPRILVVDDEWTVVELLSTFLGSKGYQVAAAYSGREALDLFNNQPFDLVLVDLRIPKIDGLQILAEMKKLHPQVPVVMVSGFGDVETVVKALKLGAENFLTKPLDMDELERTVEQSLAISCARPRGSKIQGTIQQTIHIETQSRLEFIAGVIYQIALSSVAVGFSSYDLDGNLKLALAEAITNAIEHGNQNDPDKLVRVDVRLKRDLLEVTIQDEGSGFNYGQQYDPTAEENLLRERGRGLFLIRAIMDEVYFNQTGSAVTLKKFRPPKNGQV
jgi:CheY-like chemotaxis protein